jgi:hypothetical protein
MMDSGCTPVTRHNMSPGIEEKGVVPDFRGLQHGDEIADRVVQLLQRADIIRVLAVLPLLVVCRVILSRDHSHTTKTVRRKWTRKYQHSQVGMAGCGRWM